MSRKRAVPSHVVSGDEERFPDVEWLWYQAVFPACYSEDRCFIEDYKIILQCFSSSNVPSSKKIPSHRDDCKYFLTCPAWVPALSPGLGQGCCNRPPSLRCRSTRNSVSARRRHRAPPSVTAGLFQGLFMANSFTYWHLQRASRF